MDLTSIDEITERADVGKGTFYYHFQDKEELIRDLMRNVLGDLVGAIEQKCGEVSELASFMDKLIEAHHEFFRTRWEDSVLYFQGRTELALKDGYSGIEPSFIDYLERIEGLLTSAVDFPLPQPTLRRISCAVAGFVSGHYSFAAIAAPDEDIDQTLMSLRGAIVSSLVRFVQEVAPVSNER